MLIGACLHVYVHAYARVYMHVIDCNTTLCDQDSTLKRKKLRLESSRAEIPGEASSCLREFATAGRGPIHASNVAWTICQTTPPDS